MKVPEPFTPVPVQVTALLVRGLAVALKALVPVPVTISKVAGLTATVTALGATRVRVTLLVLTGVSTVVAVTVAVVPEAGAV